MFEANKQVQEIPQKELEEFKKFLVVPPACNLSQPCQRLSKFVKAYVFSPQTGLEALANTVTQFNHSSKLPYTSSQICAAILKKGEKAFRCYECMTEDNSVICVKCFELDKHQGHHYQQIEVYGGCCDCGDAEKWSAAGSCATHTQDQNQKVVIDRDLMLRFTQEQHYALTILMHMYRQFTQRCQSMEKEVWFKGKQDIQTQNKAKKQAKKLIAQLIGGYGRLIMNCLIEFNRQGKYAIAMTHELFYSKVEFDSTDSCQFLDSLLQFVEVDMVAQKACELIITVFPVQDFRRDVTILYTARYNSDSQFAVSSYSHLSSQLYTSHITISQLVQSELIQPIVFRPVVKPGTELLQIAESFLRYYYDVLYLSRLHGSTALQYFNYHAQKECFKDFGYYRILFNDHPSTIDYYGLEALYIERIQNVVRVLMRDPKKQAMRLAMRELYKFMTSFRTKETNLFRSQQRLFAMLALCYFDGQLDLTEQQVEELIDVIGVSNLRLQMATVIDNILLVIGHAARVIERTNALHANYTFYSYYLRKNYTLFGLDSILLKLMLKISDHYNRNLEPNNPFQYEQFLENAKVIRKFKDSNFFSPDSDESDKEDEFLVAKDVKELIIFLGLLSEALYSDLPQLSIMCTLQVKPKLHHLKNNTPTLPIQAPAMYYYQMILASINTPSIPVKDFKKLSECFFKEEDNFRATVTKFLVNGQGRKLSRQGVTTDPLDSDYFRSVQIRLSDHKLNGKLSHVPYRRRYTFDRVRLMKLPSYGKRGIQFVKHLQKQQSNQSQNPKHILSLLISELWRLSFLISDPELTDFIIDFFDQSPLSKEMERIHAQVEQHSMQMGRTSPRRLHQDEEKSPNAKKDKLLAKKLALKQKMNKGAEKFLKSEDEPLSNQEDSELCCVCRDGDKDEETGTVGFISFTNFNGWYSISKDQTFPVLSSCGHRVHRSCYIENMAKTRVYTFCSLCKQPANIVIPGKLSIAAMEEYCKDYLRVSSVHREKAKKAKDIVWEMFNSVVLHICLNGVMFPGQFNKEVKELRTMYVIVREMMKHREAEEIASIQTEEENTRPQVKKLIYFTELALLSMMQGQICKADQLVSAEMQQYVCSLLKAVSSQDQAHLQLMVTERGEVQKLRSTLNFPRLHDNMEELAAHYRGKCPNCGQITHHLVVCLSCPGFITCLKCQDTNLMSHSDSNHQGNCVFLKAASGQPIYILHNRFWACPSLYEDYMGRPFVEHLSTPTSVARSNYQLVGRKYEEVLCDIKSSRIECRLRYQQILHNKVNYHIQL